MSIYQKFVINVFLMISIIIPVYNAEKFIIECIESILCQTFKDFELLLIDDGSTDSSFCICSNYALKDNRVKCFHKKNEGVSMARNYGIRQAAKEFIVFVDADDTVSPVFLSNLIAYKTADIVITGYSSKQKNKIIATHTFGKQDLSNLKEFPEIDKILAYGSPWGKLFKSEIIKKHNLEFNIQLSNHEDRLFFFQYLKFIKTIAITNTADYIYINQESGNSLSRDKKIPWEKSILAFNLIKQDLNKLTQIHQIKLCDIPITMDILARIYIESYNNFSKSNEKSRWEFNKTIRRDIWKYYTPKTLLGKIQKVLITILPNSIYKFIIRFF